MGYVFMGVFAVCAKYQASFQLLRLILLLILYITKYFLCFDLH